MEVTQAILWELVAHAVHSVPLEQVEHLTGQAEHATARGVAS